MADLKNQPPSTPVAAATRPPPDSTDAQKEQGIENIRKARATRPGAPKWKHPKTNEEHTYHPDMPEKTVLVFVQNPGHPGFYAIGRFFPNGLTADVSVTDHELAELKGEPQDIIRVVDAAEVASLTGKAGPDSLSQDERQVLAHFRSSGLGSDAYLARHQKTKTEGSSSGGHSEPSSTETGEHKHKR